jgi:hypothetical protein
MGSTNPPGALWESGGRGSGCRWATEALKGGVDGPKWREPGNKWWRAERRSFEDCFVLKRPVRQR